MVLKLQGAEDSGKYTPTTLLNELCEYRCHAATPSSQDKKSSSALTFGWLLQACLLSDIPISSEFVTFLSELQDTYRPIKVFFSLYGHTTVEIFSQYDSYKNLDEMTFLFTVC